MKEYQFEAVIKASNVGSGGAYVEFPYDVKDEFKVSGRIKVVAFFDGVEYRGSLVKMGTDCHIIGITKDIRNQISKTFGDTIQVRLYQDNEERSVKTNLALEEYLKNHKTMMDHYNKLSYTRKKEINSRLSSAKKEETFAARFEKIIQDLK